MGASEIIAYPYWCLEKGYADYAGPRERTQQWTTRAKGWIGVMYLDVVVSMLVYTVMTCAFYVLGAAVLHCRGEVPQGSELIRTLSVIYTEAAGSGAMVIAGGIANALLLLLVVYAAWVFRYRRLPAELAPGLIYDLFLCVSFLAISAVGVLAVARVIL